MTARSTIYSEVENSIVRLLRAALGMSGGGTIPNESILHYNGQMDLSGRSLAEWGQLAAPSIIVAIEGMSDEQMTQEGGRHPRSYWETLDIGIYCYDEGLRIDPQEAMEGFDATDRCRGIWKLFSDIRAVLTGVDLTTAAGVSLGWEGPIWTAARRIAEGERMQLWRLGAEYQGAVQFHLDTSALGALTKIHGDFNVIGSTNPPDVEIDVNYP